MCLLPHIAQTPVYECVFHEFFQNYYSQEVGTCLLNQQFRKVSSYQVGEVMVKGYAKTAILQIAMSGFKKYRIMPLDSNRFSEADFLPSVEGNEGMLC